MPGVGTGSVEMTAFGTGLAVQRKVENLANAVLFFMDPRPGLVPEEIAARLD
jgi:hypothetical protein